MRKYSLIIICFLQFIQIGQGQEATKDSSDFENIILPLIFYLPETSLGFSATGVATFRFKNEEKHTRPSQVIYSAVYTLKNQILFLVPFELYKHQQRTRIDGELGYFKYFYNYYGLGPQSNFENQENFDVNFPRLELNVSHQFFKNLFLGTGLKYDYFDIREFSDEGLLATQPPIGVEGGNKFNLGLFAYSDTRNNLFAPNKGYYIELSLFQSWDSLLSDYTYHKWQVDVRHYLEIKKSWIWANNFVYSKASRDTPFFDLPYLSSPTLGRGFNDRRYLTPEIYSLQSELRYPIYKKFSGVAFVSSHLLSSFEFQESKNVWAYGMGFRFEVDPIEKTRFRLDLGLGDNSFNIYFTLNEAF